MNQALLPTDWLGLRALRRAWTVFRRDPVDTMRMWQSRRAFQGQLDDFYSDWIEQLRNTSTQDAAYFRTRADRAEIRGAAIARIYRELERRSKAGDRVAEMLAPYVPASHLLHIETGESAAALAKGLENARFAMRQAKRLRALFVSRLLGASVMLVALLIVYVVLFGGYVVPMMTSSAMPLDPNIVLSTAQHLAQLFRAHPLLTIAATALAVRLFLASFAEARGPLRARMDRIFPWSIYRLFRAGEFFLLLSPMLANKVQTSKVLRAIAAGAAGNYEREHILRMAADVQDGKESASAFDTGFIPDQLVDRMYVHEAAGRFDAFLREVGVGTFETTYALVDAATRRVELVIRLLTYVLFAVIFGSMVSLIDLDKLLAASSGLR